jgi:hypothetical protein
MASPHKNLWQLSVAADVDDDDLVLIAKGQVSMQATRAKLTPGITYSADYLAFSKPLRLYDESGTDYVEIEHNGVDFSATFTGTGTWNLYGLSGDGLAVHGGADDPFGYVNAYTENPDGYAGIYLENLSSGNYVELWAASTSAGNDFEHALTFSSSLGPLTIWGDTNQFMQFVTNGGNGNFVKLFNLKNHTNDAGAASGGVPVGCMYRNGSVLMVRVV